MSVEEIPSFRPRVELEYASGDEHARGVGAGETRGFAAGEAGRVGAREARRFRAGDEIHLVARFRDFLGEPTRDTGTVRLTASRGVLHLPKIDRTGSEIAIPASEIAARPVDIAVKGVEGAVATGERPLRSGGGAVDEAGEMRIVFRPGGEFGKAEIALACDLGQAKLVVPVRAPAGYAAAEMMESVIYAFLVAIIIRIFFFQTFWIPSGSMEPTLHEGDRIIANKLVYRTREPHRGEVVIFRVFQPSRRGVPGRLTLEEAYSASDLSVFAPIIQAERLREGDVGRIEVQDYIKRVVGLPGDVVEVSDGNIYVNGEPLNERFETRPPDYDRYGPVTVPSGEVFVLGDNRSNSQDSHVIGTVPMRNIEGRAEAVFWPLRRVGLIPRG
jgi:signal peptidase I